MAAFMEPEVCFGGYFAIETTQGTEIVPADVVGRTMGTHVEAFADYLEGKPLDADEVIEHQEGWLARLSAPGYLDRTDWTVHDTEQEGQDYLAEQYGDDDTDGEFHIEFADPGGNSALRAATPSNPRNLPCPECGGENLLTPADVRQHYRCDSCADRAEQRLRLGKPGRPWASPVGPGQAR